MTNFVAWKSYMHGKIILKVSKPRAYPWLQPPGEARETAYVVMLWMHGHVVHEDFYISSSLGPVYMEARDK